MRRARQDSAFYADKVLATAAKFDVRFSITARQDQRVRAAIDAIPDSAWQPIPSWLSTLEVSGADIAETVFTVFAVFTGDKKHARQVRLVVRRVRPTPGSQLALFTTWTTTRSYRPDPATGRTRGDHRRHAVVEQTIAELEYAGLAHLPSGKFMANAAWLALSVMAHNPGRAVGQLAGADLERATAATLRRKVFTMPGRLVHSGRRRHLRLPARWPWADAITTALSRIRASRCAAEPQPQPPTTRTSEGLEPPLNPARDTGTVSLGARRWWRTRGKSCRQGAERPRRRRSRLPVRRRARASPRRGALVRSSGVPVASKWTTDDESRRQGHRALNTL